MECPFSTKSNQVNKLPIKIKTKNAVYPPSLQTDILEGVDENRYPSLEQSKYLTNGIAGLINRSADLRQFHVLDEIQNGKNSDIRDNEIEAMLEDALKQVRARKRKALEAGLEIDDSERPYEEIEKVVLVQKGHNHFDVLPENWIQITHNSGMPLYLHKVTRVCTLSKPYFLGPGSARKHEIPLSAIPCLSYRRALEDEKSSKEEVKEKKKKKSKKSKRNAPIQENCIHGSNTLSLPNAHIETVQENIQTQSLKPDQVREYCEKLFQFEVIKVMQFKSRLEERQFMKKQKLEKKLQIIMNPNGKSCISILYEYVQQVLKMELSFKFKELENATTHYAATVSINDMQYGVGYGTSKKQAKSEAAKATLEILIPEMRAKITADIKAGETSASKAEEQDLSFIDEIKVTDPRVAEFCAKTTEPSPHAILLTCLQRNFGLGDINIDYQGNTLKHEQNEFTMIVGRHTATVVCKNKEDGKQRASQAILQALHPHITFWDSLLRLYGNRSMKGFTENKQEKQEITLTQSKAAVNSPNCAILNFYW